MSWPSWLQAVWSPIDGFLRGLSKGLKRLVRGLRILRAFLVVGILLVVGSIVGAFVQPEWMPLWFAIATAFLVLPLLVLTVLVAAPLQAKSVVRLIDQGYPANARELGIRVVAQKLHDESIATEELLVDTAVNEAKKAVRKYRDAAERVLADETERRGGDVLYPAGADAPPPAAPATPAGRARCAGTTADGRPCRRRPRAGSQFCASHEP